MSGSGSGISELLFRLKQQEQEHLAEIKRKRLAEEEAAREEIEKRNEEEELKKLKQKESNLKEKLEEQKMKIFQLEMEAASWEETSKSKFAELKNIEKELDRIHEKIWKDREEFCNKIDAFLDDHEILWKRVIEGKIFTPPKCQFDNEINALTSSVAKEEIVQKNLNDKLKELEEEMEKLEQEPDGADFKRLEDWIEVTRDRCNELERRIVEKRKLSDKKSLASLNSHLFSIVNLEDVKKLTKEMNRSQFVDH